MNRDAKEMLNTAALLERRRINFHLENRNAADDAAELHAIARRLHRYDERNCCEDLTCRACGGDGFTTRSTSDSRVQEHDDCRKCAGKGHTLGRREARAEARAREIAGAYKMRAYFQGDPRGCPLYLIPEEAVPVEMDAFPDYLKGYASDKAHPPTLADLQGRWLSSNYNSAGVAVCH